MDTISTISKYTSDLTTCFVWDFQEHVFITHLSGLSQRHFLEVPNETCSWIWCLVHYIAYGVRLCNQISQIIEWSSIHPITQYTTLATAKASGVYPPRSSWGMCPVQAAAEDMKGQCLVLRTDKLTGSWLMAPPRVQRPNGEPISLSLSFSLSLSIYIYYI